MVRLLNCMVEIIWLGSCTFDKRNAWDLIIYYLTGNYKKFRFNNLSTFDIILSTSWCILFMVFFTSGWKCHLMHLWKMVRVTDPKKSPWHPLLLLPWLSEEALEHLVALVRFFLFLPFHFSSFFYLSLVCIWGKLPLVSWNFQCCFGLQAMIT